MYQYVLANLLANNRDCMGVLFLDASGETVDMACAGLGPYEMRVLGAYLGIYLRQLEKVLSSSRLGPPLLVHIEESAAHIYAVPLPDGYYLAMVQRQPALVARTRASLEDAVRQLTRELFPDTAERPQRPQRSAAAGTTAAVGGYPSGHGT